MGEWQGRLVDYFCVCGVDPDDVTSQELAQANEALAPTLLQHYPRTRPGFAPSEFADALPTLSFPKGELRAQPAPTCPTAFSIICTEPDGQRYYAFVLSYSVRAQRAPAGWTQAFLPVCWVIVSHWPFFEQFRLALLELYRMAWHASPGTWSSHVVHLCDEIPVPPRGQLKVKSVFFERLLMFSRPPVNRLPMLDGAHLACLFTCLSPENVLQLVASLATEQRIVLLSEKRETLTMVAQAALLLLFPFCEWPHALITVLPTSLADYLHAPVPYLIGLEVASDYDFIATQRWKDAVCTCFDLRVDRVTFHPHQPPPEIPERQASKLLQACHTSVLVDKGRDVRAALLRDRDTAMPAQVQEAAAENRSHIWTSEQEAELGLSWVTTQIDTRMMGSIREQLVAGSDDVDIMTIRHAYLRFFVSLLKNHKRFILESAGNQVESGKVSFDLDAFVAHCDSHTQSFVRALVNTQSFQIFINADEQDSFNRVLFDESIEMKLNRSIKRRKSPSSCPFVAARWGVDREYEAPVPSDRHAQDGDQLPVDQSWWSSHGGARIAKLNEMRTAIRVPNFVETLDRPMAAALQGALQGRAYTEESLTSAVEMYRRQLEQAAALSLQVAVRAHFARKRATAARRMKAIASAANTKQKEVKVYDPNGAPISRTTRPSAMARMEAAQKRHPKAVMAEVTPHTLYRCGEWIQYSSGSREVWLPGQVVDVHPDGSLTLEVTMSADTVERREVPDYMVRKKDCGPESLATPGRDAALECVTTVSSTQYQVGQQIEYSSGSKEAWVPATVEAIDPRARARLRLPTGRVIHDVATHPMRHRSVDEIRSETQQERRRAKDAHRTEEKARRRIAHDRSELRALDAELRALDAERRALGRRTKDAQRAEKARRKIAHEDSELNALDSEFRALHAARRALGKETARIQQAKAHHKQVLRKEQAAAQAAENLRRNRHERLQAVLAANAHGWQDRRQPWLKPNGKG